MNPILKISKDLLLESVSILNQIEEEYVIVGGWIPYLQFKDAHPGTKDVDILFRSASTEEGIKHVIKKFLENDFWLSAKHDFQLLKLFNVNGNKLLFNVDLLHPTLENEDKSRFVDHLEVEFSQALKRVKTTKSIALPYSEVFFRYGLINSLKCESTNIPVIDNTAFILSKLPSARSAKRERDIYDIYLTIDRDDNSLGSYEVKLSKRILSELI